MYNYEKISQLYRSLKLKGPRIHFPTHASVILNLVVEIRKKEKLLVELGSGIGHVAIIFAQMYPWLKVLGVEIQKDLVEISKENAMMNGVQDRVEFICADIKYISKILNYEIADIVVSNPPHFVSGLRSPILSRKKARNTDFENLKNFLLSSKDILKNKGRAYFVLNPNLMSVFSNIAKDFNLELKEIFPSYGAKNKDSKLVVLGYRKNGSPGVTLKYPIFLEKLK